jgi:hypothetical protein
MAFNLNSTIRKIRREQAKLIGVRSDIEKKLKNFGKILRALGGVSAAPKKRRKRMSAAGRRAIAAAQTARWAKIRAQKKA